MSVPIGTIALNRARAAWGDAIPAWVEALAAACDGSSQKVVARRLGYSDAAISNALRNTYKGGFPFGERALSGGWGPSARSLHGISAPPLCQHEPDAGRAVSRLPILPPQRQQ